MKIRIAHIQTIETKNLHATLRYSRGSILGGAVILIRHFFALGVCALTASLASAQAGSQTRVLVDQVGYETSSPKVALISSEAGSDPTQFTVVDDATGKVVFSGSPSPAG